MPSLPGEMRAEPGDRAAGFSLVEVLVAIAIAAGLIVGLGALLTNVGELGSRAEENNRILEALVEINAFRAFVSTPAPAIAVQASTSGFVIAPDPGEQQPVQSAEISVAGANTEAELHYARGDASAAVDLSAFESISIEYLSVSAQTFAWQQALLADSEVQAARLVLRRGARIWRPLIWMRGEYR